MEKASAGSASLFRRQSCNKNFSSLTAQEGGIRDGRRPVAAVQQVPAAHGVHPAVRRPLRIFRYRRSFRRDLLPTVADRLAGRAAAASRALAGPEARAAIGGSVSHRGGRGRHWPAAAASDSRVFCGCSSRRRRGLANFGLRRHRQSSNFGILGARTRRTLAACG